MESWEDLVRKSSAERAAQGKDLQKKSWSELEAYTAQLEFWKANLKPNGLMMQDMLVLMMDVNKELNLKGEVKIVDREKITETRRDSSYQATSSVWFYTYTDVAFGAELAIPKAGRIELVASPKFDWIRMAKLLGSGNTSNKFEVHGGFAQGDVSESFGYRFSEGRTKKLIADNIAGMKARGLI